MSVPIANIVQFWRAANYVSCVLLYLKDNVLLQRGLEKKDFKDTVFGHWGCVPGINAIYAHVCAQVSYHNVPTKLVVGTGHAGPALAASMFLEGSFLQIDKRYPQNMQGLTNLTRDFGASYGIDTEIAPEYPNTDYCGGELGGALAFSQGYAINNAGTITVCILGDGELETALTQSAWQGFEFLSRDIDGAVLPIVNANHFRMGSRSLFSMWSRKRVSDYFNAYNLQVYWAHDHETLALATQKSFEQLCLDTKHFQQPIIIFTTEKGWTGPTYFKDEKFVGSAKSHKPILRNPANSDDEAKAVESWLLSYNPSTLFDVDGKLVSQALSILPPLELRLGTEKNSINNNKKLKSYTYPLSNSSLIQDVASFFVKAIKDKDTSDLIFFSPDELESNRFGSLLEHTHLRHQNSPQGGSDGFSPAGKIFEVLNEQLCFSWLLGYSASGKRGIFLTYEAFATLCDSAAMQHLRFLGRRAHCNGKTKYPSALLLLTSLGWENCPSHQNPGFVDSLIARGHEQLRVYTPSGSRDAVDIISSCLADQSHLNVVVMGKNAPREPLRSLPLSNGVKLWTEVRRGGAASQALVAIGNNMLDQCLLAIKYLKKKAPTLEITLYALNELTLLERPEDPECRSFINCINSHSGCTWAYLGYTSTIKTLLWDTDHSRHNILGFVGRARGLAGQRRYDENSAGYIAISEHVLQLF